jgi:hypothetical protein
MKAKALLFIVIIDVLTVSSNAAIFGVIAGYCACQQGDQVLLSRFLDLGGVRGDQGKYFRGKFSKMKVLFRK